MSLRCRLNTTESAALLDALAATLTSPAATGPITVRQPRVLHVVSGPPLPDLFPTGLFVIRNGGVSHGTHMLADPPLDLADPGDRAGQADRWLILMAADAGLLGMEQLVSKMRCSAGRLPACSDEPSSEPKPLRSRSAYGCAMRPASDPARRAPSQVTSRSQAAAAKACGGQDTFGCRRCGGQI
jgi:hypothetical protein